MKKITLLAIALVASSFAFGQEVDTRDDVLSVEVRVRVAVAFEKHGDYGDDSYSVVVTLGSGFINPNDEVSLGLANSENEFRHVYDQRLDLSSQFIEFILTYDEMKMFAEHGLEYFTINDLMFRFTPEQISASRKLARKALLKT